MALYLFAAQFAFGGTVAAQDAVSPAEARAIAKQACIEGFPMVDGFRQAKAERNAATAIAADGSAGPAA